MFPPSCNSLCKNFLGASNSTQIWRPWVWCFSFFVVVVVVVVVVVFFFNTEITHWNPKWKVNAPVFSWRENNKGSLLIVDCGLSVAVWWKRKPWWPTPLWWMWLSVSHLLFVSTFGKNPWRWWMVCLSLSVADILMLLFILQYWKFWWNGNYYHQLGSNIVFRYCPLCKNDTSQVRWC